MRHRPAATLLYEDQRGPTKEFGLHDLLVALTADHLEKTQEEIDRSFNCHPMKGSAKLLRSIREDADRIAPDCHMVVAVFDRDQAHRLVGLDKAVADEAIIGAILEKCHNRDKIRVALLTQNIESVIQAIAECAPDLFGDESGTKYVKARGKNRIERDIVLKEAAKQTNHELRRRLIEKLPSLEDIADLLDELFTSNES